MSDWRDRAACRGMDPALFFPERGDVSAAARARRICAECPVRQECEDHGLAYEKLGIWGGLTPFERDNRRSARGLEVSTPQAGLVKPPSQDPVAVKMRAYRRRQKIAAALEARPEPKLEEVAPRRWPFAGVPPWEQVAARA